MKLSHIFFLTTFALFSKSYAQKVVNESDRPKLVIGLMVDQMRWDFLYKYKNRYTSGGFKKLISRGFTSENANIPYAPTVTAAGHACVYTGSVPSLNGIAGNDWFDRSLNRVVYCAEDTIVAAIGADNTKNGKMSPRNLWTTSLSDELRMATNFKGKSVGVCIKDRGAIFPAGHTANAAYWYDGSTGKWISSTYYMEALPDWLQKMNREDFSKKYYKQNWETLFPKNTYVNSTADEQIYEGKFKGVVSSSFPHKMENQLNNHGLISSTPFGNTMTFDVAKKALTNHELGKDEITDILCISLSSPDYIGHQFGPNSMEIEDNYLRLDRDIENFLLFLDKEVGEGKYTLFLTADHGVAHVPGYSEQNKMPGKVFSMSKQIIAINEDAKQAFGIEDLIITEQNNQVYLDTASIMKSIYSVEKMENYVIEKILQNPEVLTVFKYRDLHKQLLPEKTIEMLKNGFASKRSGEIVVLLKSGFVDTWLTGTSHGSHYIYDAHIPVVFYGFGIKQGRGFKTRHMTDIAPTLATLLRIPSPSGCIGEAIEEALKN